MLALQNYINSTVVCNLIKLSDEEVNLVFKRALATDTGTYTLIH